MISLESILPLTSSIPENTGKESQSISGFEEILSNINCSNDEALISEQPIDNAENIITKINLNEDAAVIDDNEANEEHTDNEELKNNKANRNKNLSTKVENTTLFIQPENINSNNQEVNEENENIEQLNKFDLKNNILDNKNVKIRTNFDDSIQYDLDTENVKGSEFMLNEEFILEDVVNANHLNINNESTENSKNSTSKEFEFIPEKQISKQKDLKGIQDSINNNLYTESINSNETLIEDMQLNNSEIGNENSIPKTISESVLSQMQEAISESSTSKNIQLLLKPNNLGTVNVNIKFVNNQMLVNVFVDTDDVQEILQQNLAGLEKIIDPNSDFTINEIKVSKKKDKTTSFDYRQLNSKLRKMYLEDNLIEPKSITFL